MESSSLMPVSSTGNESKQHPSAPTLSLKRSLQKHIRCLVNALPSIEAAEKDSKKHVSSLVNLLEQCECVERVDEMNVELISSFPDLKPRLMVKISAEAEKQVTILKSLLTPLKDLKQAMQQARSDILSLASSPNAADIDPMAMYKGTPTVPPLTTLMDAVHNMEKEARDLYCSRLYYLEDISDQTNVTSDTLYGLWMEDAANIPKGIKDCQEISKFFLEEKL